MRVFFGVGSVGMRVTPGAGAAAEKRYSGTVICMAADFRRMHSVSAYATSWRGTLAELVQSCHRGFKARFADSAGWNVHMVQQTCLLSHFKEGGAHIGAVQCERCNR